jgi:flagellin
MKIQYNGSAANAANNIFTTTADLSKDTEKLSSGYRINRAADDAAGLTISEKMRSQIRGLNRASTNAQDGISYIQTAEGALAEVHSILQRGRELSVQAANDTNTDADRDAIQSELDEITKEIDRISTGTQFNSMNVFDCSNASNGLVTPTQSTMSEVPIRIIWDSASASYNMDFTGAINEANSTLGMSFTEQALEDFAVALRDKLPTLLGNLTSALSYAVPTNTTGLTIGLKMYCEDNNVLAYVSSNGSKFTLGVNLKYLNETNGSIALEDDLSTTIAHEMTHAIMFDTVTNGMLGVYGSDSLPDWFVEGVAQAVGGAANYCQQLTHTNTINSDSGISTWLSKLTDTSNAYNAYAQGYVASMYLGYVAGGEGAITSSTIASGLNNILRDIEDGYSLSQAIYRQTNGKYKSLSDFEKKFSKDAITFTKDLFTEIGNGTGSIASPAGLSGPKSTLLTGNTTSHYFTLDPDNTMVDNNLGSAAYTGGGATKTGGKSRDGSTNPDAATTWSDPSRSGGGGYLAASVIHLQVGSLSHQNIDIDTFQLSAADLDLDGIRVDNYENSGNALTQFDNAIDQVSDMRSYYGAIQNRLEHTILNLDNTSENTQSAESRLRDMDLAEGMVKYATHSILQQVGQSMLVQSNQSVDGVLMLLQ